MSSSISKDDGPAQKKRRTGDSSRDDLPPTSLLSLPDDVFIIIVSSLNDIEGLWGFCVASKRTATFSASEDVWRALMRLRSWHPRWEFDFVTSQESLDAPDRWRREYFVALRDSIDVWDCIIAIEKFFRISEEVKGSFFSAIKPTPEAALAELERKMNHPLPNDLKELMRTVGDFRPYEKLARELDHEEEMLIGDCTALFLIGPIAEWQLVRVEMGDQAADFIEKLVWYNEDEISEDLPPCDVVEGWKVEIDDGNAGEGEQSDSFHPEVSEESDDFDSTSDSVEERDALRTPSPNSVCFQRMSSQTFP
jgi:hypothetical protein